MQGPSVARVIPWRMALKNAGVGRSLNPCLATRRSSKGAVQVFCGDGRAQYLKLDSFSDVPNVRVKTCTSPAQFIPLNVHLRPVSSLILVLCPCFPEWSKVAGLPSNVAFFSVQDRRYRSKIWLCDAMCAVIKVSRPFLAATLALLQVEFAYSR